MSTEETIMTALLCLPRNCRYHGDEVEREGEWRFSGACCATGEPAPLRRRAITALGTIHV